MALPSSKVINYIYERNVSTVSFSLNDICIYTDTPFKTVDAWIRDGLLPLDKIKTEGSGHNRIFFYEAAFAFVLLRRLSEVGVSIQRLREISKVVYELLDEPFGLIVVDFQDIDKSIRVQSGTSGISEAMRTHFRYGSGSPVMIVDLDRIHIELADAHFDRETKKEIETATKILGYQAQHFDLLRLVTVIDDMAEYKKRTAKKQNSRFPR
jgi:hypothetical protein